MTNFEEIKEFAHDASQCRKFNHEYKYHVTALARVFNHFALNEAAKHFASLGFPGGQPLPPGSGRSVEEAQENERLAKVCRDAARKGKRLRWSRNPLW